MPENSIQPSPLRPKPARSRREGAGQCRMGGPRGPLRCPGTTDGWTAWGRERRDVAGSRRTWSWGRPSTRRRRFWDA